jgi:CheY-like chemotaxis protein
MGVLVAEDDTVGRLTLSAVLKSLGHEVVVTSDDAAPSNPVN